MHVCCVGAALFRAGSVLAGESPMSSCAVPAGRDAEKALFSFPPSEPSITLHRLMFSIHNYPSNLGSRSV